MLPKSVVTNLNGRAALGVAAVLALTWLGGMAHAQTPQQKRTTDPGVLQRELTPQRLPQARPPVTIPDMQVPTPPPGAQKVRFVLNEIRLDGNKGLSSDFLKPHWEKFLGKEISLNTVFEIAAKLTVIYRNEGFILSRAIVPPQDIENGVVEIEVIEGFIDNVVIDGDPSGSTFQFDEKIKEIIASRPLHISVIERYMLLINDLAGISASSLLRPSPVTPGASELVIVVEESKINASFSVDNEGTRFIGPLQQVLTINLSNMFGLYDATEIRVIRAQDFEIAARRQLRFGSIRHTQLLNSEGTSIEVSASRTLTNPGSILQDLHIDGRATQAGLMLTHPIVRSRARNIYVLGGFQYLNSETETLGSIVSNMDRTRWFSASASTDFVDQNRGVNLVRLEIQQGVDILGARESGSAGPDLTRTNGRSNFTKVNVDLIREQDMGAGVSLYAAATGQYSFSQLLAAQEFGYGGRQFGRGYDPAEIVGDHGIAASLEIRYGDTADFEFLETYQLFAFYDFGAAWRIDSDQLSSGKSDSASSAGFGVRFNFSPTLFSSFEIARPVSRRPTSDRDDLKRRPRVFFRITGRI